MEYCILHNMLPTLLFFMKTGGGTTQRWRKLWAVAIGCVGRFDVTLLCCGMLWLLYTPVVPLVSEIGSLNVGVPSLSESSINITRLGARREGGALRTVEVQRSRDHRRAYQCKKSISRSRPNQNIRMQMSITLLATMSVAANTENKH